jgi:hypothetical protein
MEEAQWPSSAGSGCRQGSGRGKLLDVPLLSLSKKKDGASQSRHEQAADANGFHTASPDSSVALKESNSGASARQAKLLIIQRPASASWDNLAQWARGGRPGCHKSASLLKIKQLDSCRLGATGKLVRTMPPVKGGDIAADG